MTFLNYILLPIGFGFGIAGFFFCKKEKKIDGLIFIILGVGLMLANLISAWFGIESMIPRGILVMAIVVTAVRVKNAPPKYKGLTKIQNNILKWGFFFHLMYYNNIVSYFCGKKFTSYYDGKWGYQNGR